MHSATQTLCLAAAAGVILIIVAQKLRVPSIVLLLFGGVLLGPEVLGWIEPLSLGRGLETVIALAVAVILFEGGLTLDVEGYRRAPGVIKRLLTVGPLVTWLGTAGAAMWLFELEFGMALLAGSLVVVTGPTVVSPLLRRIHVRERLHHILYWEGVLVDAVGVFIAVLCYEWLTPDATNPLWQPLGRFGLRVLTGVGLGLAAGAVVAHVLKRGWLAKEHVNIFVLAAALLTFGLAHVFLTESGILAVVVAGLVVGVQHPPQLKYVKRFKLQLTELGIGVLFILLAAKLDLAQFRGWRLLLLLVVIMLVLRPVVVALATWGEKFSLREQAFLSWVAPRGIVAAAMSSLFAARLEALGYAQASYLETVTYAVIGATVTLQGLSAPWAARALGLERRERRTWVLLGDGVLVRALGDALRRAAVKVVELPRSVTAGAHLDPEDPRFADAQGVLCADTTMLQNVWSAWRLGLSIASDECYRWATFEPEESPGEAAEPAGRVVWANTVTAAAVAEGIEGGSHSIEVVEVGKDDEAGRFGTALQPLFWIKDGRARIVKDPRNPGPPEGDLAVVLQRRVVGLAGLVAHVERLDTPELTFESTVMWLGAAAKRIYPQLPLEDLVRGVIEREQSMPSAVGGGVAIPHAYCAGIDTSRCFLAVIPNGLFDVVTPDDYPVNLVFLLLSPQGNAGAHLDSLAALASIGQEPEFIRLLCRQRVPQRLSRLISERA